MEIHKDDETTFLSTLSNDNLLSLTCLFRVSGLLISKYDPWYWKLYNAFVILFLFSILVGLIISSFYRGLNDDLFSIVAITLLCSNGFFSYITMTYAVYNGHNLLNIIKSMPANEINVYGRVHDLRNTSAMNNMLLRAFCWRWILISAVIALISLLFLFVAYGSHADTHFLDLSNNNGWRVANIAYLYVNVGWLLPMVLVRVGSHFLERRIIRLIDYLEHPHGDTQRSDSNSTISQIILSVTHSFVSPTSSLHSSDNDVGVVERSPSNLLESDISITQVMSWYDDIYTLNQTLSDAYSPIIFQAILFLFPVIVFILEEFLSHSLAPAKASARLYWLITNCFVLFIMTGSAARLDALNIRIETAFASMPSSIMFATPAAVCQYRLALSKIQAIPLGINFFGLRKRITYQSMWTISSVVVSIFLFLLGYSM